MQGSGPTGARFAVSEHGRIKLKNRNKTQCQALVREPRHDLVALLLEQISTAKTVQDVEKLIFSKRASAPLSTSAQVYDAVTSWIKKALTSEDSLETVSGNIDFDLRMTTAEPLAVAAITLGVNKGLNPESLLALVECNASILEAP